MKTAGIDVVRIVWSAEYEPLHVSPSAEGPGYVQLHALNEGSRNFWGAVDLTLPADMALALAEALKACAEEQKAAE